MADRFLYEDGVELSLGNAYTLIQNIANNQIRNFTRIITQSPGFLGDSFKVTAAEKDASQSSTYYLKMEVGGVIFPNGEIFKGNNFTCRVPISRAANTQYLKVRHTARYRTAQEQAFGSHEYAEVLDGATLIVTTDPDPDPDGSELMIASVNYLPDMVKPTYSDMRDPWIYFWSSSTVIDPLEILDFDVDDVEIISSKSLIDTAVVSYVDGYDTNSEITAIVRIPQLSDAAKHAWDILIESDYPEATCMDRRMEPYPEVSGAANVIMRLPHGLEARIALRKHDAYRADVMTEWTQADEKEIDHFSIDDLDVEVDYVTHRYQPYLGLKIYTPDDVGTACAIKLWISETDNIDTDKPPRYLLGLPGSVDDADTIPYFLIPYDSSIGSLYMAYQIISPAHRILASDSQQISFLTPDFGDAETITICFGGDAIVGGLVSSDNDEQGQRIYYGQELTGGQFYLPVTQEWPTNEFGQPYGRGPERYLSEIEFINYAPYNTWEITGINCQYWGANDDAWLEVPYEPPVAIGDTVTVSNTTIAAEIPNGNYTVNNIVYDGTNWQIVINTATGVGANASGQCDLDDNDSSSVPLASLEIFDAGSREETVMYDGSISIGQSRGVHFPDTYYSDSESPAPEDNVFYEGRVYGLKFTRDSGGWPSRMWINGFLKLSFKKKTVGG